MAPIGDAPLDRTGVNIPAQRYCQTHWWSTWEGCGNNLKKRCLRQNRPRHWVLKLDLVLQLDQQTLLKPQLYDHSISPIFGEKVAFRTSREVLHRKAKWSLCIFKNQSQFRTTSEASIIFEFVVNFSLIWFGRGQELHTNKSSTNFSLACKIYPGWLSERQQGKTMQLQWSDLCQLKKRSYLANKQYPANGLFLVPVAKRWLMVSRVAREGGLVDRLCDGFLLAAQGIFHHQHVVFLAPLQQRCLNKKWSCGGGHQFLKWPMGTDITWWLIFICWKGSYHYRMFAKELLKINQFLDASLTHSCIP